MEPISSALTDSLTADLPTRRQEFLNGLRGVLPLIVGIVPFGMIYGVLAESAGLPTAAAQATSAIIFAGSSQFALVQLLAADSPAWLAVLTVVILNLRHLLYSASIAPYFQHLPPRWKAFLAYFLTDEVYAVTILKYERDGFSPNRHWFFLGCGIGLWSSWQISTALGIFLGAVIPADWPLDFALPLTFIALAVPALKDRAGLAAALSAGIMAVALASLPYNLGLILAALAGILVGLWVEGRRS
jgi:4-azaleucine resistance transporter AzlC